MEWGAGERTLPHELKVLILRLRGDKAPEENVYVSELQQRDSGHEDVQHGAEQGKYLRRPVSPPEERQLAGETLSPHTHSQTTTTTTGHPPGRTDTSPWTPRSRKKNQQLWQRRDDRCEGKGRGRAMAAWISAWAPSLTLW